MTSQNPSTIVDSLRHHAEMTPDRTAFIFLDERGQEGERTTYAELDRDAHNIACELFRFRGERALLLYPPGHNFIRALLGALYAGVVAIPSPLPSTQSLSTVRLRNIMADADPIAILTESSYKAGLKDKLDTKGVEIIATDLITGNALPHISEPPKHDDIAFLQYTSGSTGDAKGVIIDHRTLMHNVACIHSKFEHSTETVLGSWLPMFHDMGLVGTVFHPLYRGIKTIHMSPMAFLKRPALWLQMISKYKVTTSGGPNFAFDYCTNRITDDQLTGIDLSSWSVVFNGSEPIRAKTIRDFCGRFAPYGLKLSAYYPCYGLAESTLFVTGSLKGRGPKIIGVNADALAHGTVQLAESNDGQSRPLVGSGTSIDLDVTIMHPENHSRLSEGRVGEIWVRGDSVASGYWKREQLSETTFYSMPNGQGTWLRTGDLGFLFEGELFVTGRLKDTIVVAGRNIYPHDIESAAQELHTALRVGGGAAFAVDTGERESIVLLQEVARGSWTEDVLRDLARQIRASISRDLGVRLENVVFIKQSSVRKTTSGKIMRSEMRRIFITGELEILYEELALDIANLRSRLPTFELSSAIPR
jgi:acyl-CoA synthetase (AMP-forming)/AMP-acid ligase II